MYILYTMYVRDFRTCIVNGWSLSVDRGSKWARAKPSGQEVWPKPEVIQGELRGWVGKLAATNTTDRAVVTLPSRAAKLLTAEIVAKAKGSGGWVKNESRDRAGTGARGCAMPPSTRLSTRGGKSASAPSARAKTEIYSFTRSSLRNRLDIFASAHGHYCMPRQSIR